MNETGFNTSPGTRPAPIVVHRINRRGQQVPANRQPALGEQGTNEYEYVLRGVVYRANSLSGLVVAKDENLTTLRLDDGREFAIPTLWVRRGRGVAP